MLEENDQPFLKYTDDSTTNEAEPDRQYQKAGSRFTRPQSYSLLVIITSLFWFVVFFVVSTPSMDSRRDSRPGNRHNVTSHARLVNCGNSTKEARELNCKFDVLLNHWVPAPCLDQDFIEEYQDDDSWTAFADEAMTQKLTTVGEMAERDVYYTSVRDHINHCGTLWKKQFFAFFEEHPALDSIVTSPGHTDHCAQYLMDVREMKGNPATKVEVGFAGCWIKA
ncbi:uncharacterized protein PAC_15604 [Phialocephala subalpina]|uniref:Uncharacterized protein n=1 Tax=Phialocephala subalpina TaxID=576137 RepID=A0A1L7XL17_9HELO|nr:uncharacterized protein PAC_15604 [Phialocephala subalpina]